MNMREKRGKCSTLEVGKTDAVADSERSGIICFQKSGLNDLCGDGVEEN